MLIVTTSCDAGISADLWCDSCEATFVPVDPLPPDAAMIWAAARARGWSGPQAGETVRHLCPPCGRTGSGTAPIPFPQVVPVR